MQPALELKQVRKTFGTNVAVEGMDLVVPRGALYGVIGPNGAGKTTCIRMIMSILFPDSGELSVLGQRSALEAKDRIGYLPEERGVYRKMRVGAFLTYMAQLKGVSARRCRGARAAPARATSGCRAPSASAARSCRRACCSGCSSSRAIIHQPDLLILDEPFSGLDPVSVRLLRELILEEHRRGATILFSTHVMAHAEEMCEHVVMIHEGRKVLDEPMDGAAAPVRSADDPLRAARSERRRASSLARMRGVERVERWMRTYDDHAAWRRRPGRRAGAHRRAGAARPHRARAPAARGRLRRASWRRGRAATLRAGVARQPAAPGEGAPA